MIYAWYIVQIPPDKREQWDYQLEAPLPGHEDEVTEEQEEAEGEAFMAAMAMLNKG